MDILITSNSEENINYAIRHNIWQTKRTFHNVNEGDLAFIKTRGGDEIKFFGIIETVGQDTIRRWPDSDYDENSSGETEFTIKVKPINLQSFKGNHGAIKYRQ